MPFIDRDPATGRVTGEFRQPQHDGQEFLAENTPEWRARALGLAKAERKARVDAECRRRASQGVTVTVSANRTFTVQTRDQDDKLNLLGMGRLIDLVAGQNPNATVGFRDAANMIRPLSQADVAALQLQVALAHQALIAAGWDHKDAIEALATLMAVETYDIAVGWP